MAKSTTTTRIRRMLRAWDRAVADWDRHYQTQREFEKAFSQCSYEELLMAEDRLGLQRGILTQTTDPAFLFGEMGA